MNKKIKFKGKLGAFLNWPIIIAIILLLYFIMWCSIKVSSLIDKDDN
jgi:hypothetical protein